MPSPELASAWTIEELRAELQVVLPSGWSYELSRNPEGFWTVRVENAEKGAEYEESHADPRFCLLNAYGHLWMRNAPKPSELSPWVRRSPELTQRFVTHAASNRTQDVPDPEDVNPAEVEAVYRSRR